MSKDFFLFLVLLLFAIVCGILLGIVLPVSVKGICRHRKNHPDDSSFQIIKKFAIKIFTPTGASSNAEKSLNLFMKCKHCSKSFLSFQCDKHYDPHLCETSWTCPYCKHWVGDAD